MSASVDPAIAEEKISAVADAWIDGASVDLDGSAIDPLLIADTLSYAFVVGMGAAFLATTAITFASISSPVIKREDGSAVRTWAQLICASVAAIFAIATLAGVSPIVSACLGAIDRMIDDVDGICVNSTLSPVGGTDITATVFNASLNLSEVDSLKDLQPQQQADGSYRIVLVKEGELACTVSEHESGSASRRAASSASRALSRTRRCAGSSPTWWRWARSSGSS